jgi:hypothetical protein
MSGTKLISIECETIEQKQLISRTSSIICSALIVTGIVSTVLLLLTFVSNTQEAIGQGLQQSKLQQQSSSLADTITVQNTSMSIPSPNASVNNQSIPHQIVIALPIRTNGKIWIGTATFTASKPVEVEVEHKYNPQIPPDVKHGLPLNARWIDNTTRIALSPMTMFSNTPVIVTNTPVTVTNTPVTVTNTPISVGSFVFAVRLSSTKLMDSRLL